MIVHFGLLPVAYSRQRPRTHFASRQRPRELMAGWFLMYYDKTRVSDASAVHDRRSFSVICAHARRLLRHRQTHDFRAAMLQRGSAVECTTYTEHGKQNPASNGVPHVILCFFAERATGRQLPWTDCRTDS